MEIERSIWIDRTPMDVFLFLRDKDKFQQEPGSPVLALERLTPDPVGVGTRYREVVRMLPGVRGEILSVLTDYDPACWLAEDFHGGGTRGHLAYEFQEQAGGTMLIQRERIEFTGLLRLLKPVIWGMFLARIDARLEDIKDVLEGGYPVAVDPPGGR